MNNTTIGDRIKYHRKRLGLTQEQLAEHMGISAQAVSKWENNLSCPDISVLPELADLFGISVDELLGKAAAEKETAHEAEVVEPENTRAGVEWKWESRKGGIWFALYILTIGVLLLLREFVPAMDISWWTICWTTALILGGLSGLVHSFSLFCLLTALAGGFFLLKAYGVIGLSLGWGIIVPAILLLWGLSLLVDLVLGKRWRRKWRMPWGCAKTVVHNDRKLHHEYGCENGYLHCDLSFGEYRAAVVTPLLRGGSIDSSFGDFTVDFSACEALAPECTIEVDNSFGSLTLLVPDKFAVSLEEDSSFAASPGIKGKPAEQVDGTLHIKADLSFGAMEIRYI